MDDQEYKIGELVVSEVDNENELPLTVKDDSNQCEKRMDRKGRNRDREFRTKNGQYS